MWGFSEVLFLGLVLSADSFSAAVAMGSRPFKRKDALKFALCSGGAETLATLVGFLAGAHIISLISSVDHWIAFGLLGLVAVHMAIEGITALRSQENASEMLDFHSFTKVLLVSFATSLDAFGVGVSLGIAHKEIGPYLFSIGFWAFAATLVGLYLARKLSSKFGPLFTLAGAVVLGIMAVQMLKI
ncbi:manganese efflux pump [Bdellovibrio sp. 22V]|nr:manganese efflux pump [Bdellovibrio sp. 22V]WII73931.1 manganese efflux pump [Bdellovibrio sp. 22V]